MQKETAKERYSWTLTWCKNEDELMQVCAIKNDGSVHPLTVI
jgi:hypothetical protein